MLWMYHSSVGSWSVWQGRCRGVQVEVAQNEVCTGRVMKSNEVGI